MVGAFSDFWRVYFWLDSNYQQRYLAWIFLSALGLFALSQLGASNAQDWWSFYVQARWESFIQIVRKFNFSCNFWLDLI
jgi:hypothetical protein